MGTLHPNDPTCKPVSKVATKRNLLTLGSGDNEGRKGGAGKDGGEEDIVISNFLTPGRINEEDAGK